MIPFLLTLKQFLILHQIAPAVMLSVILAVGIVEHDPNIAEPGLSRYPRLAVARRRARPSASVTRRSDVSADRRQDCRAPPGLKLIVDHMGAPRASNGEAAYRFQPELLRRHPRVYSPTINFRAMAV
jgi:hypothetical protein